MKVLTCEDFVPPFAVSPTFGTTEVTVTPSSAAGGAPTTTFATPQALTAANLSTLPDLTLLSVGTVNDLYLYRTAAPLGAVDGLNVIQPAAPAVSSAYRLFVRDPQAQFQATWFVDPVAGDDRNAGTSIAPLKSLLEWSRRLRFADVVANDITVTIAAGTVDDMAPLDLHIASGRLVTIQGTVTSTTPRAIGSVVNTSPATNVRGTIGDAGGAFAIQTRLRLTSGANVGAITWVQDSPDVTTSLAVVSGWTKLAGALGSLLLGLTTVNAAAADLYTTDTLQTTLRGRIDVRVKGGGRIAFKDLNLTVNNPATETWRVTGEAGTLLSQPFSSVLFVGCGFSPDATPVGFVGSQCRILQSLFFATLGIVDSTVAASGVNFGAGVAVGGGGTLKLSGLITLNNGGIQLVAGGTLEGNLGANIEGGGNGFGAAVDVFTGCSAVLVDAASRLWGPSPSGFQFAIRTASGAFFKYVTLPTLNGSTTSDAQVGGTNKLWAALPFANTANLSGVTT